MEFAIARKIDVAHSLNATAGVLVSSGSFVVSSSSAGAMLHSYSYAVFGESGFAPAGSFPAMPDEAECGAVTKLKYLPEQSLLVLQCEAFVRCHLFDTENNCFFPAVVVASDAIDFDVVVLSVEQIIVAVLRSVSTVTLFYVAIPSVLHINEFDVHKDTSCVVWVGKLLCVFGKKLPYALHGVDSRGLAVATIPHNGAEEPQVLPLVEAFQLSDESQHSYYAAHFAVLVRSASEGELPYDCCVYDDLAVPLYRFSLLSRFPRLLGSLGPFVMVSGGRGVDLYYYTSGEHAQSFAELSDVRAVVCSRSVVDLTAAPSTGWFSSPRRLILLCKGCLALYETVSLLDIVTRLAATLTLEGEDIPEIMRYATQIGCQGLRVPPPGVVGVLTTSFFFSEYGQLLGRFPTVGNQQPVAAGSSPSRSCVLCERRSSSLKECYVCGSSVCSQCLERRDMLLLGYSVGTPGGAKQSNRIGSVCRRCDGACDNNFYRLIVARKYLDVIDYRAEHDDSCSQFDFDLVVDCVSKQCFAEEKLELCASIVTSYIHDADLSSWILKFASQKKIGLLAEAFSPSSERRIAGTSILLQLVRHDSLMLLSLVQTWPRGSFAIDVVVAAIEARLRFKLEEAESIQASCQRTTLTSAELKEAVSNLYADKEVECLVRTLVYIFDVLEEQTHLAARAYAIHFLAYLPSKSGVNALRQRPRSSEVFQHECLLAPVGRAGREFLDWWELVSQPQVLEKLLAAPENHIFISALLARYRTDFVALLVTGLDPTRSSGLLAFIVDELKSSQSLTLMELLHELTACSVSTTFEYHQLLADLYLRHDPSRLLGLVKNRQVSCLNWKRLLTDTRERKMFAEMVYIVGRTGNDKEAVRIALRCLKDVRLAIRYAEDTNDPTLWQDIENCVTQSSQLVGDFLAASEGHFNPGDFLRRIPVPNRLEVPDIGGRLSRVLDSSRVDRNIAESYLGALEEDEFKIFSKQLLKLRRGMRILPEHAETCATCNGTVQDEMFVSQCGHVSHRPCHLARFDHVKNIRVARASTGAAARLDGFAECAAAKALGGTDLVDILPRALVLQVLSFLTPESVNSCRNVTMRWRSVAREYAFSAYREDNHLFRRSVSRTGQAEETRIRATVRLTPLATCGAYVMRSQSSSMSAVCFVCGE
jgi:hypothetical protein